MQPDVSVVIVSWNVRELLRGCLDSLARESQVSMEIIVVDSRSSDGTIQMLEEDFPQLKVFTPGTNVGFSRGNNIGIRAATGRYILLLNPDTVVLNGAVGEMVAYLDEHTGVGALGPQLLHTDRSVQSSRRRFPTVWTGIFESTWLQPYSPKQILDHYYVMDVGDEEVARVDWVQGAAIMIRRACVEQVGLLDESYFMYSEELDWQHRLETSGWEVVYFPPAKIIHYGGKSSEQNTAQRDINFHTSKIRYFRKHHGPFVAFWIHLVIIGNYWWQLLLEGAKWLLGNKRALREMRIQRYWNVLRSGLRG